MVLDFDHFYPALRLGIEPIPVKTENEDVYVGLRDNLGLFPDTFWLPWEGFLVLQYFDGTRSVSEIKTAFFEKYQAFLPDEQLVQLVQQLDEYFLLDNERAAQKFNEMKAQFKQLKNRKPICAGSSYPDDPDKLIQKLESYVPANFINNSSRKTIKAIVAPHIDTSLGGTVYAPAYSILRKAHPADLYVILGICHQGAPTLFTLTNKNFHTPLGTVYTDQNIVNKINELADYDFLKEEYLHKDEHSIEFQTVFLKHFAPSDFKILPILCSFSHSLFSDKESEDMKIFVSFVDSLKMALNDFTGTVNFIASVDLAHVGPRYGDSFQPDSTFMSQVEKFDRKVLNAVATQDLRTLQELIFSNDNRYRICGYSALTTLLTILPPAKGEVLSYSSAAMDSSKSMVTFASMVFE